MVLKELREQLSKLVAEMRALVELSEREGRNGILSGEEDEKFTRIHEEQKKIERQIERQIAVEEAEKRMDRSVTPGAPPALDTRARSFGNPEERKAKVARTFEYWLRYGENALNEEQRGVMYQLRSRATALIDTPDEFRAQAVGTGAAGGFLVPEGFSNELEKQLKDYGGVRDVARMFPTPTGNDIPWPTVDDTANVGELLAENIEAASQDVVFGQVILKAFKYSSKLVPVSIELLQDSFFNVGELLSSLLAERIGRITNTHFTTGTGTGQPQGIVTAATVGKVAATGSTTSVLAEDIIALEHSLDPLYRRGASYMMADSTLRVLKQMKDSTGRWLFQANNEASLAASNQGPTVNGYPFSINQDMAAMAANAKSILFGNFSKYIVRDVKEFALLRLNEIYATKGQVGFIAFTRNDGRAINASAIRYFQNSAT